MLRERKNNRLPGCDYRKSGYYYVTICTDNRVEWLGEIGKDRMELNKFGQIVQRQWEWLREQYPYVELDEFIVMPNHVHGIMIISDSERNGRDRSLQIKSLSSLIGAFKTTSSKLIRQNGLPEFKWQKSFYDHIIRNSQSLAKIREYITGNPEKWQDDNENIKNLMII